MFRTCFYSTCQPKQESVDSVSGSRVVLALFSHTLTEEHVQLPTVEPWDNEGADLELI